MHQHTCDGASAIVTASLQYGLVKIKKDNTTTALPTATIKNGQPYPFGLHAKSQRQALPSH